jgi:hypothetical protein
MKNVEEFKTPLNESTKEAETQMKVAGGQVVMCHTFI